MSDQIEDELRDATLEVVAERATEMEASVLVHVLADEGIRAVSVGGFTAGFRAEAPGMVQVKTLGRDVERAKQVISELKPQSTDPTQSADDKLP